jgi:hypothetical protein
LPHRSLLPLQTGVTIALDRCNQSRDFRKWKCHSFVTPRAIIARMKSSYRRVSIFLAVCAAGLTCMGREARAQTTPSDAVQALVKQGQKLNSEGRQDEALKLYNQALQMSPNLYEAHLESGVALI